MRTAWLRSAACLLTILMLASVLLPVVQPSSEGSTQSQSQSVLEPLTPVQRIQAGASAANPMLVGGGTPSGAEFVESLEYTPGTYAFGGTWNTSNSQIGRAHV